MKISLVSMRTPSQSAQSGSRSAVSRAARAARAVREAVRPCPPGAHPASWTLLVQRVDATQAGLAIANAPLRAAARTVVRDLRASGQSWEAIYATLDAAVVPEPAREVKYALELEIYATRGASIVAHMHCWADVERLAELEADGTD
jgi:hypothetical protein